MTKFADDSEQLGRLSGNTTVEDFAMLSARYRRAYVQSLPTYVPADHPLADAATALSRVIDHACAAVV
jgi:hypothetical protein